jgi:flagellar biosynthetic protein FliO
MRLSRLDRAIVWLGLCLTVGVVPAAAQSTQRAFDSERFIDNVRGELRDIDSAGAPQSPAARTGDSAPRASESLLLVTLRIAGYLALVIACIFVVAWLLKKGGIGGGSRLGGGSMDILEVVSLGSQRAVVMLRVGEGVYLIGQSAGGVTLLDTFEGDRALELISASRGGVSINTFGEVLGSFVGKHKKQK